MIYKTVSEEEHAATPLFIMFKLGITNPRGWAYYCKDPPVRETIDKLI